MQVSKAVVRFLRKFQKSVGEHDTISWIYTPASAYFAPWGVSVWPCDSDAM